MTEKEFELQEARKSFKFLREYLENLELNLAGHLQLEMHLNNVNSFLSCKCLDNKFKEETKKTAIQVVMGGPTE